MTKAADLSALGSNVTTAGNLSSNSTLTLQTNSTTAITVDSSQRAAFVAGTVALPAITTAGDTNTGIFFPAADTIAFAEGGTESMRLDSSGNVGIGLTPSAWATSSAIQMDGGQSYSKYGVTNNAYYDGTNYKYISTARANLYGNSGGAHIWFNAPSGTAGTNITFTQAMTLDSAGNLGIGTTSPNSYGAGYTATTINNTTGAVFDLNIAGTRQGTIFALNDGSVTVGNITNNPLLFRTNNTERMRIHASGGVSIGNTTDPGAANLSVSGTVTASSDVRLKENVKEIPNALDKVNAIRGVTYTRNDMEDKERLYTGVIAQEIEAVLPEAVFEGEDGIKSVAYGNMVGLLIEAIKELKKEIDELKGK